MNCFNTPKTNYNKSFCPKNTTFSPRRTSLRKAISLGSNTSEIQIQLYVIILATLITALLSLGDGGIFDSNVVDSGDAAETVLMFCPCC